MRIARLISVILCLLLCGCADSPEPAAPNPTTTSETQLPVEAGWEEQLAAVRAREATRIAVSQSPVTREQWNELRTGCESLSRLEIDAVVIEDADLDLLESLPALALLKLGCEVGGEGMTHITQVDSLEVLNLPEGRFNNESLALLASLPRLKQLRFHSPYVTDDGLRIIATLPGIKYLHVIACPITADGLTHLHEMTELQSFYLDGSDIEDAAIYELLKALPSLHFHRDQLHLPDDPHGHEH